METVALTAESLSSFLARFSEFADSLIEDVHIHWPRLSAGRVLTLHVLTQDIESPSGWSRVRLSIEDTTGFELREDPGTYMVIRDGLSFAWKDGEVAVTQQEEDDWHIRGRRVTWVANPYEG
ncbi:MAG: hypothetical protein QOE05_2627 [Actinomycetota bacterium]|nr:hypothetical protein [Actinomycetota bacterium]